MTAVLMVGCGPTKVSSIDASKKFSSLSKDEVKQHCKDMVLHGKNNISTGDAAKLECVVSAIASVIPSDHRDDDAVVRAACKKTYDVCIAAPPKPTAPIDCDSAEVVSKMGRCDFTVGDLYECVKESEEAVAAVIKMDACSTIEAKNPMKSLTTLFRTGPKCEQAWKKCKDGIGKSKEPPAIQPTTGTGGAEKP